MGIINVLQIGMSGNYGGLESFIMNYYRNIDREKIQFDFIEQFESKIAYSDEIRSLGGNILPITPFKKNVFKAIFELKNIIKNKHYDIVHVHMNAAANILTLVVPYFCQPHILVVGHSHSSSVPASYPQIKKIIQKVNIKFTERLKIERWACSILAGRWLWGTKFQNANMIPNAIDANAFKYDKKLRTEIREYYKFNENDKVIGFVGRLVEEKNVIFLPKILDSLKKLSSEYKLLVVGNNQLERKIVKDLYAKIQELQLTSDVRFTGMLSNTSMIYSAIDAFVLPSFFEGFPIVAVEAQACGLPCFVSDTITDELRITNNIQFLPINTGSEIWAKKIHEAVGERNSAFNKECEKMLFPQEYDISYAAKKLEKKYFDLVDQRKRDK